MKVLITGGAGFIGQHVVRKFVEEKLKVTVVDYKKCPINGIRSIRGCFSKVNPAKYDIIVHLAAWTKVIESFEEPTEYWQNNAIKTMQFFFNQCTDQKIIFASTCAVYGDISPNLDPSSPYARSKLAAEFFSRDAKKKSVVLRLFNVYGPGMRSSKYNSVIKSFLEARKNRKSLTIHNTGRQVRDYVHVEDVAEAIVQAIGAKGGVYEVCTGVGTSVNTIAKTFGGKKKHKKLSTPEPFRIIGDIDRWLPGWRPKMTIKQGIKHLLETL